jgi:plasmid stabilization system protein ParE
LAGSQKGKAYGRRSEAETVESMLKRNLGDAPRARTPRARRHELLLKVITRNVMLAKTRVETEPVRPYFIPRGIGADGPRRC